MDIQHSHQQNEKRHLAEATQFAKNNDYDKAIVSLKNLLDLNPNNEIALGMLASIYLQTGQPDSANELLQQLLKNNNNHDLARIQLGISELDQGNNEQALIVWEPLLKQDEEYMAHYYSGLALMQLNKKQQARSMFEHANRYMPESHPLYSQLLEKLTQ